VDVYNHAHGELLPFLSLWLQVRPAFRPDRFRDGSWLRNIRPESLTYGVKRHFKGHPALVERVADLVAKSPPRC
jgi:hypothetical protein